MSEPASESEADSAESDQAVDEPGESRAPGLLGMVGRMVPLGGAAAVPMRGLAHVFAALRHRDYRNLWLAAMGSNIGSWMQNVAIGWLVFELTHSKMWLGIYGFASQAPMVVLLPLGGVLADRVDRRRILGIGNLVLALVAVSLALIYRTGMLNVWHLVGVAAIGGIMSAALIPANQSLLPRLVPARDLPNAVALNSLQFNLSRVLGPALGGVVIVALGAAWSFSLNALTFLPLIGVVLLMSPALSRARSGDRQTVWESLRGGWDYLLSRPDLMAMQALIFVGGFVMAPLMHMLPALVDAFYGSEKANFSLLLSSFGAGAVIGAAGLAARSRRGPTPWRALPMMIVFGLALGSLALGLPLAAAATLVALCGASFVGTANRLFAAILSSTPDGIRGRVSSIHVLCFSTGMPLGSLVAGWVGEAFGIDTVFAAYGGLAVAAALVMALAIRAFNVAYRGPIPHGVTGAPGAPGLEGVPGVPGATAQEPGA